MLELKNCWIGVKKQSLNHSLENTAHIKSHYAARPIICEGWYFIITLLAQLYVRVGILSLRCSPNYMWGLVFYHYAARPIICEGWYFIITLLAQLYVRVGILLTCGKHLHNHIRVEVWAFKTPSLFIEVPVPSQENERWCICVLRMSNVASFYDIDIIYENYSDSMILLYFNLLKSNNNTHEPCNHKCYIALLEKLNVVNLYKNVHVPYRSVF